MINGISRVLHTYTYTCSRLVQALLDSVVYARVGLGSCEGGDEHPIHIYTNAGLVGRTYLCVAMFVRRRGCIFSGGGSDETRNVRVSRALGQTREAVLVEPNICYYNATRTRTASVAAINMYPRK